MAGIELDYKELDEIIKAVACHLINTKDIDKSGFIKDILHKLYEYAFLLDNVNISEKQ